MTQLSGHGPNIGHGYTKYVIIDSSGKELDPIVFPAAIARAASSAAGSLGKVPTVKLGPNRYWTGYDTQLSSAAITMLGQDRIADLVFIPALMAGALGRFGHLNGSARGVCVSGLPASWCELTRDVGGVATRNALEVQLGAALRNGAPPDTFAKMLIIAEPLGLAYSMLLDNNGQMAADSALASGRLGVVDFGHRTDDTAELLRLTVVKSSLASYDLGTVRPLAEIRARLSAHFDRELSILETDQAVRNGYVTVGGQRMALPRGWDRPLIENGQAKAARLAEAWGSGNQFDRILIGGGGAELEQLTAPTLAKFGRNAVVAERPQTAIPRGYAKLARRLAGTLR